MKEMNRRTFLKASAAAAVGATDPVTSTAQETQVTSIPITEETGLPPVLEFYDLNSGEAYTAWGRPGALNQEIEVIQVNRSTVERVTGTNLDEGTLSFSSTEYDKERLHQAWQQIKSNGRTAEFMVEDSYSYPRNFWGADRYRFREWGIYDTPVGVHVVNKSTLETIPAEEILDQEEYDNLDLLSEDTEELDPLAEELYRLHKSCDNNLQLEYIEILD